MSPSSADDDGQPPAFLAAMAAPTTDLNDLLTRLRAQDLGHAVCVTDAELDQPGPKILFVNDQFERLTGYTAAEMVGRTPRMLQGPKSRREVLDRLKRSLREERFFQGQTVNYRKDGTEFLMAWSISQVNDPTGKPLAYLAVQQDAGASVAEEMMAEVRRNHLNVLGRIDARLETLEVIRELLEYADSIVDTVRTPLLVLDGECRVRRANRAFYELFRVRPDDTIGRAVFALGNGQWDIPRLRHLLDDVLPSNNPFEGFEVRHDFEQIGNRSVLLNAKQLPRHGKRDLILLSFEDVTERRRVETELVNRANTFVAMLAHELRNPLAPVLTAVQLMQDADPASPAWGQAKEVVVRQVGQMTRLVDDLLEVSRITRGKIGLRSERVELHAVVERAVETVHPLIEAKGHQFTIALPHKKLWLTADPTRLQQVLANLLNNAAKYTDDGGTIRLEVEANARDRLLRMTVRDSGVGIDPAVLPSVFDLFVQEDRSLNRAAGGLGLGLTLVKSLVEMHGGTVSATSEGKDQGSTFTVLLPYEPAAPEPPPAPPPPPPPAAAPARALRVAVVDDNRDAADTLALILRAWGHEVRTAYTGPDGFTLIHGWRPDAALVDIGLPGMSGFEVAQKLRDDGGLPAVTVAVTGYGLDGDKERSRWAGFTHHLTKPARPEDIAAALAGARKA
jgi:two-component system CheB/CheR fusion protein